MKSLSQIAFAVLQREMKSMSLKTLRLTCDRLDKLRREAHKLFVKRSHQS